MFCTMFYCTCSQCSDYMEATVCRAPSLVTMAPHYADNHWYRGGRPHFQRSFLKIFLGHSTQTPILGRGYGAPPQIPCTPRRYGALRLPRLAQDLRSLHHQEAGERTSCVLDFLGPGSLPVGRRTPSPHTSPHRRLNFHAFGVQPHTYFSVIRPLHVTTA